MDCIVAFLKTSVGPIPIAFVIIVISASLAKVGTLTPGKQADIIMLRTDEAGWATAPCRLAGSAAPGHGFS